IDVNVDELDRIIDAAMQAPLNEADGRTLKTAVHAMAERLVWRRNTEKTSAVLDPKAPSTAVDTLSEPQKPTPAGHGRNGGDAFQPDGAAGRTNGDAAPGDHAVGVDGGSREADQTRAGRVNPAGCAGQCDAQRRHQHASSATGPQHQRRTHGSVYERHRLDLWRVEHRAVLYRLEACGREPCRCSE